MKERRIVKRRKADQARSKVQKLIRPADWLEIAQVAMIWGVLLITGIIFGVVLDTVMFRLHICQ